MNAERTIHDSRGRQQRARERNKALFRQAAAAERQAAALEQLAAAVRVMAMAAATRTSAGGLTRDLREKTIAAAEEL